MCSHAWPIKLILREHQVVAMSVNNASNVDVTAKKLHSNSYVQIACHFKFARSWPLEKVTALITWNWARDDRSFLWATWCTIQGRCQYSSTGLTDGLDVQISSQLFIISITSYQTGLKQLHAWGRGDIIYWEHVKLPVGESHVAEKWEILHLQV